MLLNELKNIPASDLNELVELQLADEYSIYIYPNSVKELNDNFFFIAKELDEKFLLVVVKNPGELNVNFYCERVNLPHVKDFEYLLKCTLNTHNRIQVQKLFEFINPRSLGLVDSLGFGDRIGLANAAHIRSLGKSRFRPVLAQQSIRELTRTQRTPQEVMDAAVWAVFQEGYDKPWGSDADHLKTTSDIDLMARAGFNMFTFDPGDYVDNEADSYSLYELDGKVTEFNWTALNDGWENIRGRYLKEIRIGDNVSLPSDEQSLKRALIKYGNAIMHIERLYSYLSVQYNEHDYEVEISVDETESVTSPFEHYFLANELNRLGVKFVSLAPRFIGDFEKGIDYKGDINLFKEEYKKHLAIVKHFGNYKISLHSGSDKFTVYKAIGEIEGAVTHVKTAGTSYLEALKVIAANEPDEFREILNLSRSLYEKEKKTYHVSAMSENVKDANEYSNEELLDLFELNDARQILHVAFGKILTEKNKSGGFLFKTKLIECLKQNEETHYKFLINHFNNHLAPFN